MNRTIKSAILFFVIFGASIASAYIYGGSNLSHFGYPDHSCSRPYDKPLKPYQFNSQRELDSYNSNVKRYNQEVSDYFDCIRKYVDNAKTILRE